MEIMVTSFIINGLLGIAMYFMKLSHDTTKEEIKNIKVDLKEVRDTAYKKEDFKEFKEELWRRLDKIEQDMRRD